MQNKILILVLTFAVSAPLLAQTEKFPTDSQGGLFSLVLPRLCRVVNVDDVINCREGDQLLYMPKKPMDDASVIKASAACNLRFPVIWNKAGLSCIYSGRRVIVDAADLK